VFFTWLMGLWFLLVSGRALRGDRRLALISSPCVPPPAAKGYAAASQLRYNRHS
jgi:hypothetical protein